MTCLSGRQGQAVISLLLSGLLAWFAPVTQAASPSDNPDGLRAVSDTPAPRITALRAHLFQNHTARLSEDMLAVPGTGPWNGIAGPQASAATLVVVEVSGPPQAAYVGRPGALPRYTLRLQAVERDRGRTRSLLDQTLPLPVLGPDGKAYLPFLVRPGGCAGVQFTARLIGPGLASAAAAMGTASAAANAGPAVVKQALLPMACGE